MAIQDDITRRFYGGGITQDPNTGDASIAENIAAKNRSEGSKLKNATGGNDEKLWNVIEKGAFKENPVHSYERISYDISLHLANTVDTKAWQREEKSLENAAEINSINSSIFKGGVICLIETASTVTSMTELHIEGITSPNTITDTAFSTKWRMNVVQPLGVSLIANIYKSAAILNVKNHYSHPFFLQVLLKGRKADGEIEVEIPGTRRLYCVYIKNIIYNIDVGSANYQIEGIRAGDLNNADDHSLVQKTSLEDFLTFSDFLKVFEKEVNKQERHKLGSTKAILDQYQFRIDTTENSDLSVDELKSAKVMDDEGSRNNPVNVSLGGLLKAEIEKNTSIVQVLERFLSRNEVMQRKILATRNKIMSTTWIKKEIDDLELEKYLFTISTHNELIAYDPLRRDYARKFVYTITVTPFISITAAVRKEFEKKPAYTKKRVDAMMQRKILVKRYDYFNTGMNLDVTNFNINYNYQYVYGLDTMVGLFNKYSEAFQTIIKTIGSSQDRIKMATEAGVEANTKFNEYASDGILTTGEKYWITIMQERNLKNVKELYDTGGVEPDNNTLEAYNALVKEYNQSYKNYEHLGDQEAENYHPIVFDKKSPKLNALDSYTKHPVYGWALPQTKDKNKSRLGAQNILAETIPDEMYADALKTDKGGTQFPIQFYEKYVDPSQEGMIEVSSADGSGFNTILRNAKVGSAEMVKVTMDIIGDPYWLDHPAYSHKSTAPENLDDDDHPNEVDWKTENCILFCSMVPAEKDADSGYQPTLAERSNEFLTAIYRVWKVEHKFNNGQFTQTLHMVRDAVTDLSLLVAGDITKKAKRQDTSIKDGLFNFEKKGNDKKPVITGKPHDHTEVNKAIIQKEIDKGNLNKEFVDLWYKDYQYKKLHPELFKEEVVEVLKNAQNNSPLGKKGIFNPDNKIKFDYNKDGSVSGKEWADMKKYLQGDPYTVRNVDGDGK